VKGGFGMDFSLMDGKVECGVSLSIKLKGELFNLMKNADERIEAFLYEDHEELYINLYFSKFPNNLGKYNFILSHRSLKESESFFTISEKIENPTHLDFMKKILNFPSVIVAGTFMKQDTLFVVYRYHENYKEEMNSLLNLYIGEHEDIAISEIRKSHSFKDRMMRINKLFPLAVLQTSSKYISNELISYIYKNSPGFMAELEVRGLTSDGVRALIYSERNLNFKGLIEISKDQNIYEARHYESLFVERRRLANMERIPRIAILFSIKDDRAYITSFLPVEEMDNYMRIYSRTVNKESSYEPNIEVLSKMREDIWNCLE
jgi:hypothetical protein